MSLKPRRSSRGDKVAWLRAHPTRWGRFRDLSPTRRRLLVHTMKAAGLFAPSTNWQDVNLPRLLALAERNR